MRTKKSAFSAIIVINAGLGYFLQASYEYESDQEPRRCIKLDALDSR
jgi:hypothetical protein